LGQRWRALRGRILTPNVSATKLDVRGFHKKSPAAQELLEKIGATFLDGYRYAAEAKTSADAEQRLELLSTRFKGFAYEGAGMGFAVRDGLPLGPTGLSEDFVAGPGEPHIYMVYVGIGWAMARLPRFRWPRGDRLDLLLRWLLLDGYGFHQAYFHTRKYVDEQYQDERFPWPDKASSAYANRAIDQGIGRALWFINGTDAALTVAAVAKFAESRHADLYAGVGLAATYAGGAEESELRILFEGAGVNRIHLAQGSAFAAECRIRAGLLVPHNEVATRILCGRTAQQTAQVALDLKPDRGIEGEVPAYEVWRRRVAAEFTEHANQQEKRASA
jgi:enediyne biosynthesis protein E3